MGYGVLPEPFPANAAEKKLTYRLETVDGGVPSYGPKAKVYFVTLKRSGFLDLERAKKQASALGFVFEPEQVGPNSFRWSLSSPQRAVLDLNVINNSFTMKLSWETDPNFIKTSLAPTANEAVAEAKSYLRSGGFLPDDLSEGENKVVFLSYSGGKLIETVSPSEADFVQVDLFRKPINKIKVWPIDPDHGLARVLIYGSRESGRKVVAAEYTHTEVGYDQYETYPLISGPEAWNLLKNGQAYIAKMPKNGSEAVIREVSLAYFDSGEDGHYMQPMYMFEGDNGFVAYVVAVPSDPVQYYKKTAKYYSRE
jgi:hypothetical protein